MSSRTVLPVVGILVLALIATIVLVPAVVANRKYEEGRRKLGSELGSPFTVREFDARTQDLLRNIEADWSCTSSEVGGPYQQAMKTVGIMPTVEGLTELFNYRMPAYSWFSPTKNADAISISAVQAIIVPVSLDQTIHVSTDRSLAVILHADGVASVFRETENGLLEELWVRKGIEQDAPTAADKPRR